MQHFHISRREHAFSWFAIEPPLAVPSTVHYPVSYTAHRLAQRTSLQTKYKSHIEMPGYDVVTIVAYFFTRICYTFYTPLKGRGFLFQAVEWGRSRRLYRCYHLKMILAFSRRACTKFIFGKDEYVSWIILSGREESRSSFCQYIAYISFFVVTK